MHSSCSENGTLISSERDHHPDQSWPIPATVDIAVQLQADFADIFEIHGSSIAAPGPALALAVEIMPCGLISETPDCAGQRSSSQVSNPGMRAHCFTMT